MNAPRNGPGRDREPQEPPAGHREPRTYVTEISVPSFGGGGVRRLHAPMKPPGPEADPHPGSLSISEPGQPGSEAVPDLEASL